MPVYAYACTECGHSFDVRQSFTDDALTVCPECSGRLRKVISAVGVSFKGSGFYRTDSRAAKKPSGSPRGGSSDAAASSASPSSTDSASSSTGSSGSSAGSSGSSAGSSGSSAGSSGSTSSTRGGSGSSSSGGAQAASAS